MSMYVTIQEFKNAPTGIDTSNIIPNGTQAQNDAELYNVLMRASAWADKICNQTLSATLNTETKEITMNNKGLIRVHPDNVPIIQLLDRVQYRVDPNGPWMPVPLTSIQVYNKYFTLYNLNSQYIAPGLALQYPNMGYYTPQRLRYLQNIPLMIEYTYTNGYPNTALLAANNAGDTTLSIQNGIGINPGQTLTIYDSANTEEVVVQAITAGSNVGGSCTVQLASPLLFSHAVAIPISAIPAIVKQAVILLAAYLIKERGSLSITMNESTLQGVNRYQDAADLDTAKDMLSQFRRGVIS